ncbi:MAG: stem cell self-renewal protein Piwi domain-containing protein, partial [Actinobacteria bacterium]|nr:stem cell self-renewal protein Piwi domain-containing protein [Actinomycetota bacterium]
MGDEPLDLAVVITSADQEHLTGNASPYLVAKATFMSQGVPVQEFQVENIDRDDIAHLLNTMALACYAKLGGTPYVISVPRRPMAQELVFGIGSAHVRRNRMSPPDRFVGITTVFNSDGNYLVSNASREAPYEQYPQELLRA